ncbi:ABC transporter substrate-binding protein [Rhizobium sp. SSA_523]|uniref:ABC transporter substrate-binding protein n=1 Tax=Rhizobium sp. SSA_523 TaxID=2952477 RepID=UPI002090D227|nr:ABC transporter substrate-binding protein [Rhizobium sp. SSA_523]MCO5732491.1 ABC transporter substrate-binding protein [Rhizobium sp. SSA_523]WKC22369.1 ABC transporter substrate-binding protein [Rhizobium sp. SSA_523]
MFRKSFFAAAMASTLWVVPLAQAADLTIGSATEPSSIDPQFSRTGNNQNVAMQIFDRLLETDTTIGIHPALAMSWDNIDPLTWHVKLREGVKFHDGSAMTAEDVIFSLTRAKNIPNSPAPFSGNVASIDSMKALDDLTIEFKTKQPTPDFIEQVGFVYIVSKKAAENATIEDFNSGKAAIGTGAYKFKSWTPGDNLSLTRNTAFWGRQQDFDNVTIKFISNDASRVAALRSGAVDLIDAVPPGDVKTLSSMSELKVFSIPSARLIYLAIDASRDKSPFVTDKAGKPLDKNPLKDRKVRTALSEMINRQLIVDRILDGSGEPAGQLVPDGVAGNDPAIKAPAYAPDHAKTLLQEAGYADGFGLTLHTSNDRFPGDAETAQALGQMFARGGLKVNGVVAQPYNVYTKAASGQEFSAFIFSLGNSTPTSATGLRNLLMTYNKEGGTGSFNRVRYSDPTFDKMMQEAMAEFDSEKRIQLLQQATAYVFEDMPIIPLFWQKVHWAGKATLSYDANMTEDTSATLTKLAK